MSIPVVSHRLQDVCRLIPLPALDSEGFERRVDWRIARSIPNAGLAAIAARFAGVTALRLSCCGAVTADGLAEFFAAAPQVSSIDISCCHRGCTAADDTWLDAIAQG